MTREMINQRINEIEEKQFNLMTRNWSNTGKEANQYRELTRELSELKEKLKNI